MVLIALLLIPVLGGALAWLAGGPTRHAGYGTSEAARWISLLAMVLELVLVVAVWLGSKPSTLLATPVAGRPSWVAQFDAPWIPGLGISFHLAVDGLSLTLIALGAFLGVAAVAVSWREIGERVGLFHLALLWTIAGAVGMFMAADLFVLFFFWEFMLVPMFFLIALWGHEDRRRAALKFFLFTQFGGTLLLIAIVGLYIAHGQATGTYTFDYSALLTTPMAPGLALWLMLGFAIAFAIKLPALFVHTWLPDAHTQAPTAGSVILAGLLLKTGAYGFVRFVLPLFPGASRTVAPWAVWLGAAAVVYGAVVAFGQRDLKRLIAYTSVSHMGFVLIGVFAGTQLALGGAVLEMVAHGISTGTLFMLAGALSERTGTRDMYEMGGLLTVIPRFGASMLVFMLAALGLPGLGNFVAEFMVLAGSYAAWPAATVVAALGLIGSAVYGLWTIYRVFHGPAELVQRPVPDLGAREIAIVAAMTAAIVWIGVYPQPVISLFSPAVKASPYLRSAAAGVFRAVKR